MGEKMITARNTNRMMFPAYSHIKTYGIEERSRNGKVLTTPYPVILCYTHPTEQVNFCKIGDADPFFHFIERLWFLEAIGDTSLITQFLPRMMDFSDDGLTFNAHYGFRVRKTFGCDQLKKVIHVLQKDPYTRQAVVQIWHPDDLAKTTKNKACNMSLVFRKVNSKLDMTVFNRSNDAILGGISGANVTNLFVFLEYVAAFTNTQIGKLYIISNNLHVYLDHPKTPILLKHYGDATPAKMRYLSCTPYDKISPLPMITNIEHFDEELQSFMQIVRKTTNINFAIPRYKNEYFNETAYPLIVAYRHYKAKHLGPAITTAKRIKSIDWGIACHNWLARRLPKYESE